MSTYGAHCCQLSPSPFAREHRLVWGENVPEERYSGIEKDIREFSKEIRESVEVGKEHKTIREAIIRYLAKKEEVSEYDRDNLELALKGAGVETAGMGHLLTYDHLYDIAILSGIARGAELHKVIEERTRKSTEGEQKEQEDQHEEDPERESRLKELHARLIKNRSESENLRRELQLLVASGGIPYQSRFQYGSLITTRPSHGGYFPMQQQPQRGYEEPTMRQLEERALQLRQEQREIIEGIKAEHVGRAFSRRSEALPADSRSWTIFLRPAVRRRSRMSNAQRERLTLIKNYLHGGEMTKDALRQRRNREEAIAGYKRGDGPEPGHENYFDATGKDEAWRKGDYVYNDNMVYGRGGFGPDDPYRGSPLAPYGSRREMQAYMRTQASLREQYIPELRAYVTKHLPDCKDDPAYASLTAAYERAVSQWGDNPDRAYGDLAIMRAQIEYMQKRKNVAREFKKMKKNLDIKHTHRVEASGGFDPGERVTIEIPGNLLPHNQGKNVTVHYEPYTVIGAHQSYEIEALLDAGILVEKNESLFRKYPDGRRRVRNLSIHFSKPGRYVVNEKVIRVD